MAVSRSAAAFIWFCLGFGAGLLACVAGYSGWRMVRPDPMAPMTQPSLCPCPTPTPTASFEPSPLPTVEPTLEPSPVPTLAPSPAQTSPTPAATRRPPSPLPSPRPPTPNPDIARRLTEGDRAALEGRFEAALVAYEQALQLQPSELAAQEGRARVNEILQALKRAFFSEPLAADGGTPRALAGFEGEDVVVKRAPDTPGRVDFVVAPAHVKPGDDYTVTIYVANLGKRGLKLKSLRVTQVVNGARTPMSVDLSASEVKRGERMGIGTLSGKWPTGAREWSVEAQVQSNSGDGYAGRVVWR